MRIVCFGEIMLRLCPPDFGRFVQAENFSAFYGGSEANTAVSLASFGADCVYVTNLPENDIGQAAVNSLRRYGVDISEINRKNGRMGIYYLEAGASQRPSKVVYDRAGSVFALAEREDFDWDKILDGADIFHFSGITPALGGNLPDICFDALRCAEKKNITVSCDLNYRKNLWSYEKAGEVLIPMMEYIDILIANEEHADKVLGVRAFDPYPERGIDDIGDYGLTARMLAERFDLECAVVTVRRTVSASDNKLAAVMFSRETFHGECYFSRPYDIRIIDRVGAGDALDAGLIYALLDARKRNPQDVIEFAVAASVLKHTVNGDMNLVSVSEVDALVNGRTSGRVER